jgi:predicted nucleic acid-binding protein
MAEIWVVNASPLIALAKVGHVDLLAAPGRSVVVPAALDPEVVEWSLGAGESAVLSLSRALGALAILDDREARVAARTLGVRFSGTLGIIVQAARAGRIASAAPLIRALRSAGLYLSDHAVADALRRHLGESWEP